MSVSIANFKSHSFNHPNKLTVTVPVSKREILLRLNYVRVRVSPGYIIGQSLHFVVRGTASAAVTMIT